MEPYADLYNAIKNLDTLFSLVAIIIKRFKLLQQKSLTIKFCYSSLKVTKSITGLKLRLGCSTRL